MRWSGGVVWSGVEWCGVGGGFGLGLGWYGLAWVRLSRS